MLRTRAVQRGVMRVRVQSSVRHTLRRFLGGTFWRRSVSLRLPLLHRGDASAQNLKNGSLFGRISLCRGGSGTRLDWTFCRLVARARACVLLCPTSCAQHTLGDMHHKSFEICHMTEYHRTRRSSRDRGRPCPCRWSQLSLVPLGKGPGPLVRQAGSLISLSLSERVHSPGLSRREKE